ncbi:CAZyme family GT62 [Paecilomyces variotii]|uniref:N-glycosyl-transferase n=1 Tax=Byssochlamys spectabilis TaxID=264951 RepID=A0A443HZZ2_BYSSP|nr:N-glycosyl-transferase [Paecilomyces variotii]KAJ9196971.1 CAZyme family GT62 [Paecilomyces variotii]KAJ9197853.1 CAZyme family GT62 [Paecilomyces variotii]KAJ9215732.1 CAZyme family GT62 [Paecilomyces variotii]KAJ9226317.1 CAZyme family GT62 [Paecilomyces variotii]KAJ9240353.1 CAZyme family GT62 [Paecilomyces variotii]
MLLPKGGVGVTWKSARARLPPWRALVVLLTRTRFLITIAVTGLVILLWRGISKSAAEMQNFYCYGSSKSPMEMSINEMVEWNAHLQTPVIFNHHEPYEVNSSTIHNVDLNPIKSTTQAVVNRERVLILTPLRDAAPYLPKYFDLLSMLTYPHELIDLAFLVGDSTDDTLAVLSSELNRIQAQTEDKIAFRSATIVQKDFGAVVDMNVEDKHSFAAQGPRRKAIGRARNYLLYSALKPEHSWVYWRDVDIVDSPEKIIEDFIAHDKDILVPNIWFHRYKDGRDVEGKFDYNSWIESDKGRRLAASLDKDTILAEGYKEYDTGRTYLVKLGDWRKDKDEEVELDGIGGVNILVKADVHRSGINFPAYSFENQAETEGFAKMAKRAGYQVVGLPNYVVWHIDTEEKPGNLGDRKAY